MEHRHDRNLLTRRDILAAYVTVLERPVELLQVCARSTEDTVAHEIAQAFGIRSEVAADAVRDLQVRRFTPDALVTIRQELADTELRVRENGCAAC